MNISVVPSSGVHGAPETQNLVVLKDHDTIVPLNPELVSEIWFIPMPGGTDIMYLAPLGRIFLVRNVN